jgi:hypothetical protein
MVAFVGERGLRPGEDHLSRFPRAIMAAVAAAPDAPSSPALSASRRKWHSDA